MAKKVDMVGAGLGRDGIKKLIKVTDRPFAWRIFEDVWALAERAAELGRENKLLRERNEYLSERLARFGLSEADELPIMESRIELKEYAIHNNKDH